VGEGPISASRAAMATPSSATAIRFIVDRAAFGVVAERE
jgi:hypothetical protein